MAKKARDATSSSKKTKSKPPAAVGSVVGHNDQDDAQRALFLQHRTTWNEWQAKRKVLEKLERDLKAALKNDGFMVKEMTVADQLMTLKGEIKVTDDVKLRLRVARWVGHPMGSQLDLFVQPDRTPSVDKAFDAGKQDSMENRPRKPPFAPETEQYRAYMAGYEKDQERIMGGFKAPAETAPAAEPLAETAPAAEPEKPGRKSAASKPGVGKDGEPVTSGTFVPRSSFSKSAQTAGVLADPVVAASAAPARPSGAVAADDEF